jgi:Cu-Zn family superoxide dismutase
MIGLAGLFELAAGNQEETMTARAAIEDASGATVGDAILRQTPNGVLLKVDLRGVMPGIHAFHIHDTGRCEPPTFQSAGGHFAPDGREHGFFDKAGPHAGDLPNAHVLANGDLSFEYIVPRVTLTPGPSLFDDNGSALVFHSEPDDYRTDPAGDAGDRIACGEIMR